MNWNQIQYVIVTAEEKNMTRAAKKLYISQPSLSISMKQLEQEIGSEIFERKNGQLELTYVGKLFYEWAKTVDVSQNRLWEHFLKINSGVSECIKIGISPHRSTAVTPQLLKTIYARYPLCEIHVVEKPSNELKLLLDSDQLDLIVDIPKTDMVTYHSEEITDEGMCLAVPKSFTKKIPFADEKKDKIALENLGDYGFIMLPQESDFGKVSRKCLELAGIVPRIICECTFSETVRNLVEEQIGIALLPDFFASTADKFPNTRFYQIKNSNFRRSIAVVYKNERYHSVIFLDVVDIIKQVFQQIYSR